MTVDRAEVGNVAAEVMGRLEERFGDREDASVRAVMLIVAVDHVEEDERGVEGQHTEVSWGVSDGLPRHETSGCSSTSSPTCGASSERHAFGVSGATRQPTLGITSLANFSTGVGSWATRGR